MTILKRFSFILFQPTMPLNKVQMRHVPGYNEENSASTEREFVLFPCLKPSKNFCFPFCTIQVFEILLTV